MFWSRAAIANELGIAEGTVKVHAKHVYEKMGIHSRNELLELYRHRR